jgi:hypothetical protein
MTDQATTPDPQDAITEPTLLGGDGGSEGVVDAAAGNDAPAPNDADTGAGNDAGNDAGSNDADASAAQGAPETYDLKAPEGMELDTEALKAAEPVFRALAGKGLSNDDAQKVLDLYGKDILPKVAAQVKAGIDDETMKAVVAQRKAWADETMKDPELGGTPEQHKERLAASAKAIDAIMGDDAKDFRSFLNDTGLGNNRLLNLFTYRVGSKLQEGAIHVTGAGEQVEKTTEQKLWGPEYQPKS